MKKLLLLISFFLIYFTAIGQNDYYWYKGQKIVLEKIRNKKFIMFNSFESINELSNSLNISNLSVENFNKMNTYPSLNPYKSIKIEEGKWAVIKSLSSKNFNDHKDILYEAPFYYTKNKVEAGLSNLFYVKLKTSQDINLLEKLAASNSVVIMGNNKFMPLWYTLSCSKKSKGNALEMANMFYETGMFLASEPDLMTDDSPLCTNDTHFSNQWGLENTGQSGGANGIDINYCLAQQISTGNQNIVVAVVDQGVELNHPDLPNMHAISYNTETDTSPSQVLGNHGVACAGIIGADSNNGTGIAGIAPDSPIMSISNSLAGTPNSRQTRANGISFAWTNGASVISNSWGSAVQYQIIDDAIDDALTQGRNGLGCIVVFASGNDNGVVSYPANSNDDILVVGAMNPCGERKTPNTCEGENWGSNFGSELDIVAPGVLIPTTDRQGANGYNTTAGVAGDYTQTFNGTSSACPHVSGIAALVLSVNPDLSATQVNNIIESSAQKVGSYNYINTTGRPNGTWYNEMGYGLVDAYAAVQMAQPIFDDVDQVCFDTNTTINLNNSQNFPVTWQVSYNVNIISSNNNSITIRSKYADNTGTGWVKATFNGNEYTETFGVNGSENEIPMSVTVSLVNNYLTINIHDGSGNTPYYLYFNNVYKLSTNSRTITFPYYQSSGRVEIRNQNSCETGWNYAYYTGYFGGSYYYSYNVYPNPASETLTLERKDLTLDNLSNSNFDINKNISYELYNFNQNLVSKGQITNLTNIDVSNFKKGRYILLIITNGNYESHNIIIN